MLVLGNSSVHMRIDITYGKDHYTLVDRLVSSHTGKGAFALTLPYT